jgi:opacity protein-like surface antigen
MPRNQLARLALLLCLAFASFAQAADDRGGYMGGALGTFDYSEPSEDNFLAVSDNTTQYQLFGGYRVSNHFGVEFALGRTQDLDTTTTILDGQGGQATLDISQYFDIYALKAIGFLPFRLTSLYGGVGYYSASLSAEVSVPGFGTVLTGDGHFSGSTAGIGIQRDFRLDLKSLSVRGEYTWYDFDDGIDASGFTVGVLFRF